MTIMPKHTDHPDVIVRPPGIVAGFPAAGLVRTDMWRDVVSSWSILGLLLAALFLASYLPPLMRNSTRDAGDTGVYYVHRQTWMVFQDRSGKYTIYLRALTPIS